MTSRFIRWAALWCVLSGLVACKEETKVTTEPVASAPVESAAQRDEIPVPTVAKSTGPASAHSADAEKPKNETQPFLWVATTDAGKSYLLGTVHLGQRVEDLPAIVDDKLQDAKTFVMEADATGPDAATLMQKAMLPEGKSLEKMLGPERWNKLVDQVGTSFPPQMLTRFKPWFAMIAITQSMLPKTAPMDQVLQQRAKKLGKRMVYLETMAEQLALFESVIDLKMLEDGIDDLAKQKTLLVKVQSAYSSGDAPGLETALFDPEEMKKHPKMFEVFFYDRNAAWIPKLKKELDAGNAFIAVGAGHLLGDKSVLTFLAKEGIKVERIAK